MRVAITGVTGLIGSALRAKLQTAGHDVVGIGRRHGDSAESDGHSEVIWDPSAQEIDANRLEGLDALVNLAGEPIGGNPLTGRWTSKRKDRILRSRVDSTRLIADTVLGLDEPPAVVLNGSATGFYGSGGPVSLDEDGQPGDDFLADVVSAWENAAKPIAAVSRLVMLRTGLVLSPSGGALAPLTFATRMFMGGPMGDGNQIWSWISLDDEVSAIEHLINTEVEGPINLVAPNPVSQRVFARELGRVLKRPAVMPAPRWAVKLALGEMAGPLVFTSANVVPTKLNGSGFVFGHTDVGHALESVLT